MTGRHRAPGPLVVTGADVRARAVHEAGHATAALALGVHVESVSILDGVGGIDATEVHYATDQDFAHWPTISMAGGVAGELFDTSVYGARADAEAVLAEVGEAGMMAAYADALALLGSHRLALATIADALAEHGELSGEFLASVFRQSVGP